jgi:AsmA protein
VAACLLLAGLTFLLVAAPVDFVRDRLMQHIKAQTGREAMAGSVSLSIFPHLAVSLRDVAVSAPEGMSDAPTLAVPLLEIELGLLALLSRQPAIERLTLHQPVVELHIDGGGRRSWDLSKTKAGRRTSPDADVDRRRQAEATATAVAASFAAQRIRVIGGTVRYRNELSGTRHEVGSLDLELSATEPNAPMAIEGALIWRGARMSFAGSASPAGAVVSGRPARLVVNLSGPGLQARYEGKVALDAGLSVDGSIDIRSPSVQGLRTWLDQGLDRGAPEVGAADPLVITARLLTTDGRTAISPLEVTLGKATLTGVLAIDAKPARLHVGGELKVTSLDAGVVLTRPGKRVDTDSPPSPAPAPAPAPAPPGASPPAGQRGDKGWSEQPINLAALNLFDADLMIVAEHVVYKQSRTGKARLGIELKGGIGQIFIEEVDLYDGRGRGVVRLDGSSGVLAVATELKLDAVSVQPLLADALGFNGLEGRGVVSVAIAGQGLSERQIVETLSGKVEIAIANGAMAGVDVGKVMRGLPQGRIPSLAYNPNERTPFSELSGTFDIAAGKARNNDLKVVSTNLQLAGEGVLDLGPRQVDYTLRTKVSGNDVETGPVLRVGTFEIPIGIKGPWENPAFSIKGQEQLTDTIRHIGKLLRSKEAQEALKGLIGGNRGKRREETDKSQK